MNSPSLQLRFLGSELLFLAACALMALLTGCISHGRAKEAHLTIGWPGVLAFEKHEAGVSLSESGVLKAADSSTKFSVLLLTWESRAKDLELKFEKDAKSK